MNQKLLTKVLASLLAVILSMANFVTLGIYASKVYATTTSLEVQSTNIENGNIEFDAYFETEKGTKTHSISKDLEDSNLTLSLAVDVKKGYLKNAKIEILGEDGNAANFRIINNKNELTSVQSIDVKSGTLFLKQINAGTGVKLDVPFESLKEDIFDLSNFNKIDNIKLMGTYVSNEGKTTNVEKQIQVNVSWKAEAKTELVQELVTYIPYLIGEEEGTIVQTKITTGLENNVLPIKETDIVVQVPEVEGKRPEEVIVSGDTYATNGSSQEKFSKTNYTYDKETGKLEIKVTNESSSNKVTWNKTKKDEYIVTYIYSQKQEKITSEQKAQLTIKAYNSEQTELKEENILTIEENEVKGNYITSKVEATEALSKGYLYTKSEKEIEYKEEIKTAVVDSNIVDKITIEPSIDNFIDGDERPNSTSVGGTNYAYYKTTSISKENFEKVLGTEGSITIYGKSGEQLAVINKENKEDENGNYTYEYKSQINQIKIETSKPISNNTLKIENVKSLKGKTDYSINQIASFENLQIKVLTSAEVSIEKDIENEEANNQTSVETKTQTIANIEEKASIRLVDPTSQIEVGVNNANLSTIVKNENVEFRVILKTNDITCSLYKNPMIEIELPSYIEELAIKDINLLYDNELEIESYNSYKNEEGNIVIDIILKGEDTIYNTDQISKGANIVINTDVTLKKLTPTTKDIMKVYVSNQNQISLSTYSARSLVATASYAETALNAIAPVGIVTTNTIEGYNTNGESVTSISGEEKVGKLETITEAKTATIKANIINNYENKINNISILGRIPSEDITNPVTGENLGNNLTTTLSRDINISGATIYYSENGAASKDVTLETNAWSITRTQNAKSYLILLDSKEMVTGENIEFSYGINIPANLPHNLSTYGIYTVYYDNVTATQTTSESVTATKVGLTTGQGPELEVKVSLENGVTNVEEGKNITYNVEIKNIGKIVAKNIVVKANAIQQNRISQENEQVIEQLAVGEASTLKFTSTAKTKSAEEETIKLGITITAEDLEKAITTESTEVEVTTGYFKLDFNTGSVDIDKIREEGEQVDYVLQISNVNFIKKENVVVKDILPNGVTFKSANLDAVYDETSRTVTWNLGTIQSKDSERLILIVTIDNLAAGETSKTIKNSMNITTKDKELQTDEVKIVVNKGKLEVTQSSSTIKNVEVGNNIIYNINIKNIGKGLAKEVKIKDIMPSGLKYINVQYSKGDKTYTIKGGANNLDLNLGTIEAGNEIDLSIKVEALELDEGMTSREIKNKVVVSAENMEDIASNEITHIIVPAGQTGAIDPSTGTQTPQYYNQITGIVWLDENKDGKQDIAEQRLSGINVTLINAENGQIVKDLSTGKNKEQQTSENGIYTFSNLEPGSYIVIFDYDASNYSLTSYHKDGVNDDKNSDAISTKATINGQTKPVGASDKIIIIGETSTNKIDMGLVINAKFDLKLTKTISKISLTDSNGDTKVNDCKDKQFAKIDIKDKTLKGSNVIVEYKISVTNEGDIAGYVKKIVDYIPQGMKFQSELNQEWYQSSNGDAYNASLANILINPGQTKEVTLVLVKTINSDNDLGLINNIAEIAEAYNDLGIEDIDSIPANKVQDEDDISLADVMIGIKTGEVYVYALIGLITISIFGIGIYFINKKVLRKI